LRFLAEFEFCDAAFDGCDKLFGAISADGFGHDF